MAEAPIRPLTASPRPRRLQDNPVGGLLSVGPSGPEHRREVPVRVHSEDDRAQLVRSHT